MTVHSVPPTLNPLVTFEEAEDFQLRLSVSLTPAERLRDLEDMLDFNDKVEQHNPQVRWIAEQLRADQAKLNRAK